LEGRKKFYRLVKPNLKLKGREQREGKIGEQIGESFIGVTSRKVTRQETGPAFAMAAAGRSVGAAPPPDGIALRQAQGCWRSVGDPRAATRLFCSDIS